jgi:hypothetical protein
MSLHEENTQVHEERDAILHAEREWNPLRTVPVGGARFGVISGTLSIKSDPYKVGAKDTRVYLVVQNLSATDYLIVSHTTAQLAQNAAAPVGGPSFPIPPGKTLSIPSRGECYLMAPSDASAPVQFSVMDIFD